MKKSIYKWFITLSILFISLIGIKQDTVHAAGKSYGLAISNSKGHYTYYDLNGVKGTQRIEKNSAGKVMVPLKKVCSYMPTISYDYDWNTQKATIKNRKNGKKIVVCKNSQYIYTYASKNAKAKKVKLSAKSYLSSGSNALMADVNALKYVFAKTTGYKFYSNANASGKKAIGDGFYNSPNIRGIIVYNPYAAVSALPKATAVSYVSEKDLSNIVKVTIPEGYSAAQIANLMVNKGVCQSTRAFLQAVNSVSPSSYWFLKEVKKSSTRCFYLEGYLYPSTYEFYKNTSPASAIATILKNTGNQFTKQQQARAKELGYTMDQVLTIASIIEKEVSLTKEQPNVSSVLHNRLNVRMKLQCDATIYYVERYIKPYITGDVNRYNAYYNTNKCKALPSGPICNPGKKAIQAALYPNETNYFYFCSDKNGAYYYAETYEEHLHNLEKMK